MLGKKIIGYMYKKFNNTFMYALYKNIKNGIQRLIGVLRIYALNDKKIVRVKVTGWWNKGDDLPDFPIFKFLGRKVIVTNFRPQLQLVSVFTQRKNVKKINKCKTIFFTGEDCTHNHVNFSDYCTDVADLSIGFRYEDEFPNEERKRIFRFPLWFMYIWEFWQLDKDKIVSVMKEFENSKFLEKNKFCTLIASHDRWSGGIRKLLFDACSTIGEIKCPGKLFHNDDTLKQDFNDRKVDYLKQFRFSICPENCSTRGYITEKIFHSLCAGAIPIYSGGGEAPIEPNVLNQNIIIRYDGNNIEEVVDKVSFLENNNSAYREFLNQPTFTDTAVDWMYDTCLKLKDKLENLMQN